MFTHQALSRHQERKTIPREKVWVRLQCKKTLVGKRQYSKENRPSPYLCRALSRGAAWLYRALDNDACRSVGSGSADSDNEVRERAGMLWE